MLDLRRGYPADFRGEIEQFGEMVSPEDMKRKLQVARAEARRYRKRYGIPLEFGVTSARSRSGLLIGTWLVSRFQRWGCCIVSGIA